MTEEMTRPVVLKEFFSTPDRPVTTTELMDFVKKRPRWVQRAGCARSEGPLGYSCGPNEKDWLAKSR